MGFSLTERGWGSVQTPVKKESKGKPKKQQELDLEKYERGECTACRLCETSIQSPQMSPNGSKNPGIYFLAEAPGRTEDARGIPLIGEAGNLFRNTLYQEYCRNRNISQEPLGREFDSVFNKWFNSEIRLNNTIRCWPGQGISEPTPEQKAACKPSVLRDIIETKPKVVVTFGRHALEWFLGRAEPFKIYVGMIIPRTVEFEGKSHSFFLIPTLHPSQIVRSTKSKKRDSKGDETVFKIGLRRAINLANTNTSTSIKQILDLTKNPKEGVEYYTDDKEGLSKAIDWAIDQPFTATDIETHSEITKEGSLHPYDGDGRMNMASISDGIRTFAFPLDHPDFSEDWQQFAKNEYKRYLKSNSKKIAHNLAFELIWWFHYFGHETIFKSNVEPYTRFGDTFADLYTLQGLSAKDEQKLYSLDNACELFLGFTGMKDLSGVDRMKVISYPIRQALEYNALDSKFTAILYKITQARIKLEDLVESNERYSRSILALAWTKHCGVPISEEGKIEVKNKIEEELLQVDKELMAHPKIKEFSKQTGKVFNIRSYPDVKYLLQDLCKYSLENQASKKEGSTGRAVLEALVDNGDDKYGIAKLLVRTRQLKVFKSNFVEGIDRYICKDGKIHADFNPWAVTQRVRCDNPNMQNFPKRGDIWVRTLVRAIPGYILLDEDEAQIEARLAAQATNDPDFIKFVKKDGDVHTVLSNNLMDNVDTSWRQRIIDQFKKDPNDEAGIRKAMRTLYKAVTFAVLYFAEEYTVQRLLNCTQQQAKKLIEAEWAMLPTVKGFMQKTLDTYYETGYVRSVFGARFGGNLTTNSAVNYPIQNGAAVLTLEAMYELAKKGRWLLAQIHDEVLSMVPENEVDEQAKEMAYYLTRHSQFRYPTLERIPIVAGVDIGTDWSKMKAHPTKTEWSSVDFGHTFKD